MQLVKEGQLLEALTSLEKLKSELESIPEAKVILAETEQQITSIQEQLEAIEMEWKTQYMSVLSDLIDSSGVVAPNHEFNTWDTSNTRGLVYADLIDFSGDGQPELYTLFMPVEDGQSEQYNHRSAEEYNQEIWGMQDDGELVLLNHELFYQGGLVDDLSVAITQGLDGLYYLNYSSTYMKDNISMTYEEFQQLTDNEFEKIIDFSTTEDLNEESSKIVYSIDDQTVEQNLYDDKVKSFKNRSIRIIDSGLGSKSFALDLSSPTTKIMEVVNKLAIDPSKVAFTTEVSDEEKSTIQKILSDFYWLEDFDNRNIESYSDFLLSLSAFVKIPFNYPDIDFENNSDSYYLFQEKTVVDYFTKRYFDMVFDEKGFSSTTGDESVYYEDGIYYVASGLDGWSMQALLIHEIQEITKYTNNIYLVEYGIKTFNSIEYSHAGGGSVERYEYLEDYLDVPTNEWPQDLQSYLSSTSRTEYAVIKKNEYGLALVYQSDKEISETELLEF
ncbi:hypothetical protein [Lysinibacillus antri]|uniref:Uncharacterized protein n=1 Tax=Lysinibacillus antri TaxID=2498145 RepID=A0A3S0PRX7_9BACI|nr:hypothetical protein [Lysinibacillus antri]RUL55951.1 hypothetical protein EK386_03795 [Lysinibacillus antri]